MKLLSGIFLIIALAGCGLLPSSPPTQAAAASASPEPSPISPTGTPVPDAKNLDKLSIWVPAKYNPVAKSPASLELENAIEEFESENPGITVEIRVKADSGSSGLLETLSFAAIAAPDAMPSLVLLTRSQMENASRKGIIFPYDGLTSILDETDWYPYARELATFKGNIFGMPLSGDALALVSRSNRANNQVPTWEEIQKLNSSVLFAAADPQAAIPLALYRSAGGETQDDQNLPKMQLEELETTLTFFATGADKNIFPPWLINYQTDAQVMETFSNQQGGWMIAWLSNFLRDKPKEVSLYPVPSLDAGSATFASGSVLALTETNLERRQLAVKLAEFLAQSKFLAKWNLADNTLPPRPSALTAWPDTPLRGQLNQVALDAKIRPPIDILTTLGPAVQEATIQILKKQIDPAKAAQTALQRLTAPDSK